MDGFKISDYGQNREVDATPDELRVFELVKEIADEPRLTLERVSNNYLNIRFGELDLARLKLTQRTKWISFPYIDGVKERLAIPEDVRELEDKINKAVDIARDIYLHD